MKVIRSPPVLCSLESRIGGSSLNSLYVVSPCCQVLSYCHYCPETQGSLPPPTVPHGGSALAWSLPLNCLRHL